MLDITRRSLFAGALFTAAAAPLVANAASASSWLRYDARLRARLADAGGGTFLPRFERGLLRQTNALRRAQRLAPFAWDNSLAACARAHAADMVQRGYFAHEAPGGFTPFDRASLLARDICGSVAENLAMREYPHRATAPSHIEDMWETSPGHRQNLLHPSCTHAGYGVVKVGHTYYAAALYGDPAIRLPRPLPLRVRGADELNPLLAGASPRIDRLAFTHPGENPPTIAPRPGYQPALRPGVWQLRPMVATGGRGFDVLTGPLFVVG